jgi:hypothetical protein
VTTGCHAVSIQNPTKDAHAHQASNKTLKSSVAKPKSGDGITASTPRSKIRGTLPPRPLHAIMAQCLVTWADYLCQRKRLQTFQLNSIGSAQGPMAAFVNTVMNLKVP